MRSSMTASAGPFLSRLGRLCIGTRIRIASILHSTRIRPLIRTVRFIAPLPLLLTTHCVDPPPRLLVAVASIQCTGVLRVFTHSLLTQCIDRFFAGLLFQARCVSFFFGTIYCLVFCRSSFSTPSADHSRYHFAPTRHTATFLPERKLGPCAYRLSGRVPSQSDRSAQAAAPRFAAQPCPGQRLRFELKIVRAAKVRGLSPPTQPITIHALSYDD